MNGELTDAQGTQCLAPAGVRLGRSEQTEPVGDLVGAKPVDGLPARRLSS
ncbi:hypothetical protein ABZ070_08525 [Streptomyces sp. NPDC006283]